MTRSASQIGRSNRRRGAEYEAAVEKYLRGHGHPHAERRQSGGRADRGDIVLVDSDADRWVIDTKTIEDQNPGAIEAHCRQVATEADNADCLWWALVVKRKRSADVGASFVWLPLCTLIALVQPTLAFDEHADELACITLRAFAQLLAGAPLAAGVGR